MDDKRFKTIQGLGGANVCRNLGLKHANSKYVIFLDSDDQLKPNCLRDRLAFFEAHPEHDFVVSQTTVFKEHVDKPIGHFRPVVTSTVDNLVLAFVEHKIQWNTTGPTWKKSFLEKIGDWNEDYPRLQDVELHIRALLNNPRIGFVERNDSYYYQSHFTSEKQYHAQFGFLYLIRDYYLLIKLRYKDDPKLLERFRKAFLQSIHSIQSYYQQRDNWYNPRFNFVF